MQTLRWKTICPHGEFLHMARISAKKSPGWQVHRHDFFEFFLVDGGGGDHLLGGAKVPLAAGHLVFIRPEHAHGFRVEGPSLTLINTAFEASVAGEVLGRHPPVGGIWESGGAPATLTLPAGRARALREFLGRIGGGGRDRLDAEFALLGVLRLCRSSASGYHGLPEWLACALPELDRSDHLREGLSAVYRVCGRSPEHVSRSFRKHLGQTPSQWLNAARIQLAKRLLETTSLSVLEVSMECGFESPSYFHKLFAQLAGGTPLAHRQHAGSIQEG